MMETSSRGLRHLHKNLRTTLYTMTKREKKIRESVDNPDREYYNSNICRFWHFSPYKKQNGHAHFVFLTA